MNETIFAVIKDKKINLVNCRTLLAGEVIKFHISHIFMVIVLLNSSYFPSFFLQVTDKVFFEDPSFPADLNLESICLSKIYVVEKLAFSSNFAIIGNLKTKIFCVVVFL